MLTEPPDKGCGIIVFIPCFREPDILNTLESLSRCTPPKQKVEIIVLLNHSEVASEEIKNYNFKTREKIEAWLEKEKNNKFRYFVLGPVELPKKWAGVGLARKSAMDEAVLRFNQIEKPFGIIVSLDADTLVEKNYLVEIEKHFKSNPGDAGATIAFQHQTEGLEEKQLKGILLYEKFLLYYRNALEYVRYPNPIFTIGSAFTVTAEAYVKRGGMTRRQAGEDFYFLQTLTQVGKVGEINSTKVFPSARTSDRIPFGTGPAISKWMNDETDLSITYDFQAFIDLKMFFDSVQHLFQIDKPSYSELIARLPEPVFEFLIKDNFWTELDDLNKNCSSFQTFQLRFFHKFNAFKILKFINFSHEKFYQKSDLDTQFERLEKSLINS